MKNNFKICLKLRLLKNSDYVTKIDMVGHVNSLNASVAAALYFNAIMESKNAK